MAAYTSGEVFHPTRVGRLVVHSGRLTDKAILQHGRCNYKTHFSKKFAKLTKTRYNSNMTNLKSKLLRPLIILTSAMTLSLGVSWFVLYSNWDSGATGFTTIIAVVFVVNLLVLAVGMASVFGMQSGEIANITESLQIIQDQAQAIEQGKVQRGEPVYFQELLQAVTAIEAKVKLTLENLNTQITHIDEKGIIDQKQLPTYAVAGINLGDIHKKLERISRRAQQLFAQTEHIDTSLKKSMHNDPWEQSYQKLIVIQKEKETVAQGLEEIQKFVLRLHDGELGSRLRLDHHKDLEKSFNDFVGFLDSFLRDIDKAASSNPPRPINENYKGQFSNVKAVYNRCVETHTNHSQTLQAKIVALEGQNRELSIANKMINRPTRGDGVFKAPIQAAKFAEMDFSGKPFGKY